jgi:hypothetical protein
MRVSVWILLITLAALLGFACDDEASSSRAPSAAEQTLVAGDATPITDEEADARNKASALCPEPEGEFRTCVEAYVYAALSGLPALLCINNDEQTWYLTTPGATPGPGDSGLEPSRQGEPCREPGFIALADTTRN